VKVAFCSLSEFTYVAECVDAAVALAREHDVRYLLGFRSRAAVELLESRGLSYEVVLNESPTLAGPAAARSTADLFAGYFFKQAEAVLPQLPGRLAAWGADIVLSHLRDFAGINAAAIVGVPVVSFGSHANPVRSEPHDPPFGSGLSRTAPERHRRLMWEYDREFHAGLDAVYNRTFRLPYGLAPVQGSSRHTSDALILLSTIPALGNTNSPTPDRVRYVGSLFSKSQAGVSELENGLLERLANSPRPRVFVSLGTTYSASLVHRCLGALEEFGGTVIASGTTATRSEPRFICAPFFQNVHAVLRACDAVVTVCGGKSVMDALAHGLPIVGLPRQGEQRDIAMALREHGAAMLPGLRKWDARAFCSDVETVCRDDSYREASSRLKAQVASSGGSALAASEVLRVAAP